MATQKTPAYPGGSSTGPTGPIDPLMSGSPVPPPPQLPKRPILAGPVYFDFRKKRGKKKRKKRNKKYTRGTKGWQRLTLGLSRAGYRSANSVARGFNIFQRRSNRSMRRKRNGLVRDSLRNLTRGFGSAASELGRAPFQVARQISTRRPRRLLRQFVPAQLVPGFNRR
jgi:hypothetical protein